AAAIQTQLTSAQTALAAAIESNATASTTNATSIAALQTSLEAVTATLAELKASLATASTTAEVAALTTSLAAVQADLTELLAQNNVYSTDVEINSAASLAVAKSLGNKLMILNADLIITQSTDMSAADLQAVVDKVTTITGDIQYTMSSKTSTNVNFNKLTSAAKIYMDVAGEISFPLLTNVKELHIDDSHLNYITGVSLPALTTITTFGTNSTATYTSGSSAISSATANAINAPKATNIDLGALATYDAAALTITGKLDHTLDLAAITSKKKDGSSIAPVLTINGAKTVDLPLLTKGTVTASTSKTIKLPLFIGNSSDNFSGAETITLGAYTQNLTTGAALKTIDFTGAKAENAKATDEGPNVTLSSSTAVTSATLGGVLDAVTVNFSAANTSLETLTLTGKANAVTVNNANGLTSLSLGHTAEQSTRASLSVTNNIGISSLSFDKLASAVSLTVTGNDALTTISADALATVGGTGAASIVVEDNDFTASQSELTKAAAGTALAEGKFTSTSGMKDLQKYIDAGITRFATKGGTIYAAFDTLESYLNIDDVADSAAPYTWSARAANTKLEVAHVSDAGYTPKKTVSTGEAFAKRSFVIEVGAGTTTIISGNGETIVGSTTLNDNAALAVNQIVTEATTATATALGISLSAGPAEGQGTVTFGALDNTAENSPTTAAAIAAIATGNT
ncbi:hypothetical protein N9Q57_03080, partial [Flavobacteriaceae bacterium]|nr:hypothetical protein [Flavobacteriaceae bacterium]